MGLGPSKTTTPTWDDFHPLHQWKQKIELINHRNPSLIHQNLPVFPYFPTFSHLFPSFPIFSYLFPYFIHHFPMTFPSPDIPRPSSCNGSPPVGRRCSAAASPARKRRASEIQDLWQRKSSRYREIARNIIIYIIYVYIYIYTYTYTYTYMI